METGFVGKKVAILTSGGDSQGMNSAIRGAGRMIMSLGGKVYGVKWGYQGLVDGGESNIREYNWTDLRKIIHLGGTVLGSARCDAFRTVEGRSKAAFNLVSNGINNLIVVGGDGSLTGADVFRSEWPNLLENLVKEGKISEEVRESCKHLSIVGMVGSIDNDFCGTDMTIGTDSALHRIIECADSIVTTAESHKRAFVLEIMGRNSGYLALSAGISIGADFMLIPESPPDSDWKKIMCETVIKFREFGRNYTMVLVSEGAKDSSGKPITSKDVKEVLEACTKLETRITVLGHIQRGGSPSSFDRILALRQGIEAAVNVLTSSPSDPSYVICIQQNRLCRKGLNECINMCKGIKTSYDVMNVDKVVELRGKSFMRNLKMFNLLNGMWLFDTTDKSHSLDFAVVHVGAPCAGMNSCTRAITMFLLSHGHSVFGIKNGFAGFTSETYTKLNWSLVDSWFNLGGSELCSNRSCAEENMDGIVRTIERMKIKGVFIIGGFDGVISLKMLKEASLKHEALRIPWIFIPATISNSIPFTNFSLGSDTTLNIITKSCDSLRLSAQSSRKRIFVVETFGKKCGYLALMTALSSGADNAYIYELSPSIYNILKDVENFKRKFQATNTDFGLLIMSDKFSDNFKSDFLVPLLNDEGRGRFTAFLSVLGHIQQGSSPSPFDRFLSAKFGYKAADRMVELVSNGKSADRKCSALMIGSTSQGYQFTDIDTVMEQVNARDRTLVNPWWLETKNILNIMANTDYVYPSVTIPGAVFCNTTHQ